MRGEWKRGIGKVSKRGVLKLTALALTLSIAVNYTKNEIVREIEVLNESDSVRVIVAPPDSNIAALVDSLTTLVAEVHAHLDMPRDSVVVRYVTAYRDSIVERVLQIPVYRDSTVIVPYELPTPPPELPTAWELWGAGPRVP